TVTFVVTDSLTGQTISHASVKIDGKRKAGNEHGALEIQKIALGTHQYVASAKKYLPATASFNVTGSTTVSIQLAPVPPKVDHHQGKDD
ncbi:MAG: hypothetical protein WCH43_13320, partial [Verrucomicrobiota bacterium]